jgi:hypothetical protein
MGPAHQQLYCRPLYRGETKNHQLPVEESLLAKKIPGLRPVIFL